MRNRIVLIEWEDSNVTHGWVPLKDDYELARCQSVGFAISEDEQKMVISTSITCYDTTLDPIVIPKSCIKSIKEMRVR